MAGNVQCPVCTLFLLPGMNLSDHLETHPKEQVIKALVQMSLKSESSEPATPETPKKANKIAVPEDNDANQGEENERDSPNSEMSGCMSSSSGAPIREEINSKLDDGRDNCAPHTSMTPNVMSNTQVGYVFENNSNSSSSSSNTFFGPPNTYYHQQQHQQHNHHHHHQQQQQSQSQQQQHLQNYQSYPRFPQGGNNNLMGSGLAQPPMRLFSYQQPPKPLQPPPAYGAAISQLRSQNSQNMMSHNINRPLYSPTNYTIPSPTSTMSMSSTSSTSTSSRLPPPLPPPPLNQRYQANFEQIETNFNESGETNMSPRRRSMTPPIRPPPQLYRSPQSSSNAQFSRQSSSPYSVMSGSPSVLRYAESPVTAHYLERENGDFIVQETPKHVVECVEKDDGEFSVIERVYHMPPSVVQINEDEDDNMSEHGSNSEDIKLMEDERQNEWSSEGSSNQGQTTQLREQLHQKKSAITVLSDVQLDLSEYLDLVGNIFASGKVAKNRTELIKVEKFEPDEVKEEMGQTICLDDDDDDELILNTNEQKVEHVEDEKQPFGTESTFSPHCLAVAFSKTLIADSLSSSSSSTSSSSAPTVAPVTTSVIRLAANVTSKSTIHTTATTMFKEFVEDATFDKPTMTKVEESSDTVKSDESQEPVERIEQGNKTPSKTPSQDDLELSGTSSLINKTEEKNKTANLENSSPQNQDENLTTTPLKQIKKEVSSPIPYFQSAVRRPIKKLPKKLIIKPKSKETTTPRSETTQPQQDPIADPIPPIAIQITIPTPSSSPLPSTSSASSTVELPKEVSKSEEEKDLEPQDEINIIKTESLSTTTSDSVLMTPLFADADEILPPDDDSPQPSTSSSSIVFPEEEKKALEMLTSDKKKPTADLTAFFDECLKKEDEEDHPMHSIFGMDIGNTVETLNEPLTPPPTTEFPSPSLFAKPLTTTENLSSSISEPILLEGSSSLQEPTDNQLQHEEQHQQQQQNNSNYVEYPFSFLYGGEANQQGDEDKNNIPAPIYCTEDFNKYSASTSGGNSASCTWYQSQSSENDFEIDGKGSYLDLDSCKRSTSFAAATEGSMPTSDALNIRTDEKMPAKGEISEQESNCGVENSWSQPLYNEFSVRFVNPYPNFMSNQESWSHDHYFRPQDLSSSVETKNFALRLTEESPPVVDSLPSTSKRRKIAIVKTPRKKNFQCAHCNTHFPLLKEKNAHMIKQHGYKRVNRRLIRDPPTSTVTTATLNTAQADGASALHLGLEGLITPPALPITEDEDSKATIVKLEQEKSEECKLANVPLSSTKVSSSSSTNTATNASRTKYDSMRARDNRMLINFNLSALNVKNEGERGEAHNYYMESKSSFCCFVCKRDFLTVKLFDEHLVEHPAECFTCHKKFTRWKNFMVHLKRHLGWKDFACTYCDKKFVIRSALVEHMRMHTGQTPLKCKVCGKSFKRYSNLTQHRKRHGTKTIRTKEYVCYCGEVLPSKARFLWHKETHDVKPKCCPYCRDRFVHANSLRRHIRLAHSDKFDYTEPMECPMCKQIYAKSSIKAHMATHSMDTQHECLICNKSFSTKWNLKIHNWVHANRTTKPFKCKQCVKAFVREVDYNNHINSHKQIKPYTCEHCGCKFIRKYNYIRHRREHHGNKKFTCDLCGKLFHRHYYLIEHRRIHTGERPFQCTICGKSSTTKTNHNKHLKIHHSRDPFTSEA